MFYKLFNSKTNNFTFAAMLVAGATILSGLLGVLRDRFLAGTFGAGEDLDIYFAAFRIPDFLQAILVIGGINATFLPMFSQKIRKGKEKAIEFSNSFLNGILILLLISCFILIILTPYILKYVVPGFNQVQMAKTITMTRIMFLSPILFSISAVLSGILHFFNRFLIYSLAPIFYNFGIIIGILFFTPIFGIYGLAFGVIFGALMHFLIQVPAAKNSGYNYSKILNFEKQDIKKILKLMIPSSIGSGFAQINFIVITALCSILLKGSLTIFTFSNNLQSIPISVISAPFAIACFPVLSKSWNLKDKTMFENSFSLALRQILFLTIPLGFLIFLLRAQIVRVILGTGLWGWQETRLTAACLGVFSLCIFGYSLIPLFQKSFYAIQDTKTPTFLQIFAVLINIILSLLFLSILGGFNIFSQSVSNILKLNGIPNIQVLAFPLALSISSACQSILLFIIFFKKTRFLKLKKIAYSLSKILLITGLMGISVLIALRFLAIIFQLNTFWGVFFQATIAGLFGILVYYLSAFVLKLPELKHLKNSTFNHKTKQKTEDSSL
ncbi:MAG: murein biosynthesis integral membrane protein MurJ [Candidatus Pacebacteria bacterium]|nr:murein biosynthesis integral membrane protein MurJ [Candidatus Paceibacterota bacterium]